jgi:Plavaka transposase
LTHASLSIHQVADALGLTFRSSSQLNKMIDGHLNGRPPFVRREVLAGDEVCEVWFRDIIQCIKALFGDPDFAPYLVFLPERHYTNETRGCRVWHDMHTGRWWWATQVRVTVQDQDVPRR